MPSLIQVFGKCQAATEIMEQFKDRQFCADHEQSTSLELVHEEYQQCATINDMFDEVDKQTLMDSRTECLHLDFKVEILKILHLKGINSKAVLCFLSGIALNEACKGPELNGADRCGIDFSLKRMTRFDDFLVPPGCCFIFLLFLL